MRRVYTEGKKRRPAVEEALRQMRRTREALGPDAMARLERLVAGRVETGGAEVEAENGRENAVVPEKTGNGSEVVDRKRTLLTVMKFLEMQEGNKSVQTKIRALLSKTTTIR